MDCTENSFVEFMRCLLILSNAVCMLQSLLVQAESRQAFFLAAMSHELRSPLTTVLGCTTLLEGVASLGAESKQCVSHSVVDVFESKMCRAYLLCRGSGISS